MRDIYVRLLSVSLSWHFILF